jgi:hypothetical protein
MNLREYAALNLEKAEEASRNGNSERAIRLLELLKQTIDKAIESIKKGDTL